MVWPKTRAAKYPSMSLVSGSLTAIGFTPGVLSKSATMRPITWMTFLRHASNRSCKIVPALVRRQICNDFFLYSFYNFRVRWVVADAPMLSKLRKKVAHNGFWGCPCCQAQGKTEALKNEGGTRCFGPSSMRAELWTHDSLLEVYWTFMQILDCR